MFIKPIHGEADDPSALATIETLCEAVDGSPEADRLAVVARLVATCEKSVFPIEAPDPVDFPGYVMAARARTRKGLEPCIGAGARVSVVRNRVCPLTRKMIRRTDWGCQRRCSSRSTLCAGWQGELRTGVVGWHGIVKQPQEHGQAFCRATKPIRWYI